MAQQVNLLNLDLETTKKDIEYAKKLYCRQCPKLNVPNEQKDLWRALSVGLKNRIPLLQLIIDSYSRDRTDYYLENKKNLELNEWAKSNNIFKCFDKKKHHEMLKAGVDTFLARYSPIIYLPTMEKICDSLEDFVNYISRTSSFIQTLIEGEKVAPPFQIDLVIIPNKIINTLQVDEAQKDSDADPDDSDSDFDDDDDSDDDAANDEEKQNESDDYDPNTAIPDIKKQLDEAKVVYEHRVLNGSFRHKRDIVLMFKELKKKMSQNEKQKDNNDESNFALPHKQRLCVVVDRRKGRKKNELFMYKPTESGDMPSNKVSEWGFQSAFDQLIPSKNIRAKITAKTPAKGYMFCLSFSIEEKDSIQCHLYTQNRMMRFLPTDISTVLPVLFVDNEYKNDEFVKDEKKIAMYRDDIRFCDVKFDEFRAQTSSH